MRALRPNPDRAHVHLAHSRHQLPFHDENRTIDGLRAPVGLKTCTAEECQRSRYGELRYAAVLLNTLFQSSKETLPIPRLHNVTPNFKRPRALRPGKIFVWDYRISYVSKG